MAEKPNEPKKQRKTQTKTDTGQQFDKDSLKKAFQQPKDFPAKHEPEKKTEPPKAKPKLKTASAAKTRQATQGIQLPQDALDKLSRMRVDVGDEPETPQPTYDLVKPETLPKVINTQLQAAGMVEPEWHMIRNLPGYMVQAIRALGRPLFATQTKTQLEKIQCLANLMGQGPNTDKEINAVVKWAKENGKDLGPGDIDFERSIPGYAAKIYQFATDNIRFMLVKDDYGSYVYAWPEQDSVTPMGTKELGVDYPKLREHFQVLGFTLLESKKMSRKTTNISDLVEEMSKSLNLTLLESEQKIQFIAQQMAMTLLKALQDDQSRLAHDLAKKMRAEIMKLHKEPTGPGPGSTTQAKEDPKLAKLKADFEAAKGTGNKDIIRQAGMAMNQYAAALKQKQDAANTKTKEDAPNAEPLVRELAKADPTGESHDYLQYICRMYAARQYRLEDVPRLHDELTKFIRFRSKIENKDLNSYQTLDSLYDIIEKAEEEFGAAEKQKSKAQQEKEDKIKGAEVVVNDPYIKVVHLKTADAARLYAAGTRWCTSAASTFQHYARQGAIYVILAKTPGGPRKFQMHYESEQVMNERDQHITSAEIKMLSDLPPEAPGQPNGWTKFLNYMIQLKYSKYFEQQKKAEEPKKKAAPRRRA